ncbi:LuxR C-terminal-related transcriptional regulator [Shinella yambaruensis]|uniref:HTH luxR-type domain-containing protein n=1 Tax=Shinella yambaruensis TaxID=415996 RepID=A0ABQ5ZFA6_9HYPH|nr:MULTISPECIES: LuxR C-terminal-related transcriptional regulator [Shinella]CAI0339201.1 Transcriptional regulator [Rhizobiaceae bacterium]CAK7257614.1 ATP-dependent transcriptional regulator [Shinella sp. WSC3-e]MCJ8026945.1 LuxR C-terminal-related transcriptional regulator [Shinella yambaruensis]MCO5138930.1 LuxR C-terminal-related transcriptional regulator [Shinella sp.]MCU7982163.1 LuxR C-terminal-related transcriptional regulator [Shinella yambaruensis]
MSSENDLSPLPELTEIEKRCLELAANGRTPADIVLETDIAMTRVTDAMRSAIEKLGARNITGAITRAVRLRLI